MPGRIIDTYEQVPVTKENCKHPKSHSFCVFDKILNILQWTGQS